MHGRSTLARTAQGVQVRRIAGDRLRVTYLKANFLLCWLIVNLIVQPFGCIRHDKPEG
jgi:hypothetical protein